MVATPQLSSEQRDALRLNTTTFIRKKIRVLRTNKNSYFNFMKKEGMMTLYPGGTQFTSPVTLGEVPFYHIGNESETDLNKAEPDLNAYWQPTMSTVNFVLSIGRILDNRGPDGKVRIKGVEITKLLNTIINNDSVDAYGDGEMEFQANGLKSFMTKSGTNKVYAGIATSDVPEWDNLRQQIATALTYANLIAAVHNGYVEVDDGMTPTYGLATHDVWVQWLIGWDNKTEVTDKSSVKDGRMSIGYNGVTIMYDRNSNFNKDEGLLYLLRPDTLFYKTHKDANWVSQNGDMHPSYIGEYTRMYKKYLMGCDNLNKNVLIYR